MLLMTKLKNEIKRIQPEGLEFYLRNININGARRGCSGFIKNTENGNIVYVNTEKSCYEPLNDKNLYRTAKDLKDFSGGQNRWSTDNNISNEIVELLRLSRR